MASLWIKLGGLLHNGASLYACDVCPCPEDSSFGSSSGSGSGSGSGSANSSDGCTSSTCVEVPCCPGVQIPRVLYANFDGGNCAGTYTMVWNDSANHWFSEDFPEGLLEMSCQQDWYLQIVFEAFYPDSITCEPFELVFNIAGSNPCGTFTLTVTG